MLTTAALVKLEHQASKKEDKRVCTRMCEVLRDHLESLGFGGVWQAALFKKTGGGGATRIEFKRPIGERFHQQLLYFIRPLDRDSSWLVLVSPPDNISIQDVVNAETKRKDLLGPLSTPEPEPVEEAIALNIGQMYKARVVEHVDHGLYVEISAKDGNYRGLIGLADLSETYDRKILNQYPIGKPLRVVVSTIDEPRKLVTCSIRVTEAGIAKTTHSSDLFTGQPDKSGLLSLEGFTKDMKRKFQLLEWMAVLSSAHYPKPIPHEVALSWLMDNLKMEYGATSVDKRGAATLFSALYQGVEPLVQKVENLEGASGRGYLITEFGWGELGGVHKWVAGVPAPPPVAEEATAAHDDATTGRDGGTPAPMPISLLETPLEERVEKIKEILATPAPEVIERPILVVSDEKSVTFMNSAPPVEEVAEYIGKMGRLIDLRSQQDALAREQDDLERWLKENSHLQLIADRVYKRFVNGLAS